MNSIASYVNSKCFAYKRETLSSLYFGKRILCNKLFFLHIFSINLYLYVKGRNDCEPFPKRSKSSPGKASVQKAVLSKTIKQVSNWGNNIWQWPNVCVICNHVDLQKKNINTKQKQLYFNSSQREVNAIGISILFTTTNYFLLSMEHTWKCFIYSYICYSLWAMRKLFWYFESKAVLSVCCNVLRLHVWRIFSFSIIWPITRSLPYSRNRVTVGKKWGKKKSWRSGRSLVALCYTFTE